MQTPTLSHRQVAILVELVKAGGEVLHCELHRRACPQGRSENITYRCVNLERDGLVETWQAGNRHFVTITDAGRAALAETFDWYLHQARRLDGAPPAVEAGEQQGRKRKRASLKGQPRGMRSANARKAQEGALTPGGVKWDGEQGNGSGSGCSTSRGSAISAGGR